MLIADEILAVGDFLFQQKCEKRMQERWAAAPPLFLWSHSIEQIERMCNKVTWLEKGRVRMQGSCAPCARRIRN